MFNFIKEILENQREIVRLQKENLEAQKDMIRLIESCTKGHGYSRVVKVDNGFHG